MPAERLTLADSIILKLSPSGERFTRVQLVNREHGLVSLLKRINSKRQSHGFDLFDQGEVTVDHKPSESSNFGFLLDFNVSKKRSEIGKRYERLKAAAWISGLLLANPLHAENSEDTFILAERALDSLCTQDHPFATLLKTLYVFARDEGYPVLEDWVRNLSQPVSTVVHEMLNRPLSEIDSPTQIQANAFESLTHFIELKTHIHVPHY